MPDKEKNQIQNLQRNVVELSMAYDATIEGFARAMDLHLIWQVGYLRTNQPQITLKCRHICI